MEACGPCLGGERQVDGLLLPRETISGTPGFVAGFHLRDPQTGKGLSLSVYEDAEAAKAAGKRMQARPADKCVGVDPDSVQWLEVHPF